MAYAEYKLLRVTVRPNGVCVAVMHGDHPSGTNVMTPALYGELSRFIKQVAADDAVRALVVRSAADGFWIAHYDVTTIIAAPTDKPPQRPTKPRGFSEMCETVRTMPKPTIAEVVGRAGGGGCEFASSFDMRFGALGRTIVTQSEVGLGLLPGGSGTVRWPALAGRGRAMEMILGCIDLDAATAERWGWLNRAFPTPESCTAYVDWLADRMAGLPPRAMGLAKQSILYGAEHPTADALNEEQYLFRQLLHVPESRALMRRFIDRGGQTYAVESRPDALLAARL